MTLSAKLQFGDNVSKTYNKEYLVDKCICHLNRNYNHNHPDSDPRCERISIRLNVPAKEDLMLMEWFIDQSYYSGRILVDVFSYKDSSDSEPRIIYFNDAQCYSIQEHYDVYENKLRRITLELDCMSVSVSDCEFSHL